jgi:hypothetical protein
MKSQRKQQTLISNVPGLGMRINKCLVLKEFTDEFSCEIFVEIYSDPTFRRYSAATTVIECFRLSNAIDTERSLVLPVVLSAAFDTENTDGMLAILATHSGISRCGWEQAKS